MASVETERVIKEMTDRKKRYEARNDAIRRWHEAYFQLDRYSESGHDSFATPDSRAAVDLGIYILSRHPHQDRVPFTVHDAAQRQRMNKVERWVQGNWRMVDFEELMKGQTWHQYRLAAMMVMCGWYAQFTGVLPDSEGFPMPIAEVWDPSRVYPEWGAPRGYLTRLDHEYVVTLGWLRDLIAYSNWNAERPLEGDDDQVVTVLDHWESRYSRKSPKQPDILNSVLIHISGDRASGAALSVSPPAEAAAWIEVMPLTNRTAKGQRGFTGIPVLVGPVPRVELSSAYFKEAGTILAHQGAGLLASVEAVQDAMNRYFSRLLDEIRQARLARATVVTTSPSGADVMEPQGIGTHTGLPSDTTVGRPLAFTPDLSSSSLLLGALQEMFQRNTFAWTNFGQASFTLSGVAIERLNESAQAHLGPFQRMMEHIYQVTDLWWVADYRRRWEGKRKFGLMRLQGRVESGFYDEEFRPDEIPETHYFDVQVPLALAQDDMMRANIARALYPQGVIVSPTYVREKVLKLQDEQLEARRVREDMIETAPFMVNKEIAGRLRQEIIAAQEAGDDVGAGILGIALRQLMLSLAPAQGRGIPERPGMGSPEAGGVLSNQGGGRPALSPANMPVVPGAVAASASPSQLAQAERNIAG